MLLAIDITRHWAEQRARDSRFVMIVIITMTMAGQHHHLFSAARPRVVKGYTVIVVGNYWRAVISNGMDNGPLTQ